MIFKLLVPVLILLLPGEHTHDFHVSKTEVNYNSEQETVQITVHVFIDDLELALMDESEKPLHILTENEVPEADSLIGKYLSQKLHLNLDGQQLETKFLGKEISDDLMGAWCYLESPHQPGFEELSLVNTLLCEIYDDQKNIVSVKKDNKTRAFDILDVEETKISISFD